MGSSLCAKAAVNMEQYRDGLLAILIRTAANLNIMFKVMDKITKNMQEVADIRAMSANQIEGSIHAAKRVVVAIDAIEARERKSVAAIHMYVVALNKRMPALEAAIAEDARGYINAVERMQSVQTS